MHIHWSPPHGVLVGSVVSLNNLKVASKLSEEYITIAERGVDCTQERSWQSSEVTSQWGALFPKWGMRMYQTGLAQKIKTLK